METPQHTPIKDLRIPYIIEKKLEGHTYTQISKDLDINRKTLYDIRKKDDFQNYLNTLIPLYDQTLKELMKSEQPHIRLGASLEFGRMIRSGVPKEIHQRTEKAEIKIILHDFKPPTPNPPPNTTTHTKKE